MYPMSKGRIKNRGEEFPGRVYRGERMLEKFKELTDTGEKRVLENQESNIKDTVHNINDYVISRHVNRII